MMTTITMVVAFTMVVVLEAGCLLVLVNAEAPAEEGTEHGGQAY